MDNTIVALRNLYVALGGTASNVADLTIIPDVINAIAALIESGATAELPAVTSSDNGKFLTVSGGKWTKGDVPAELPAVTASDNGKVLKVADGAWGVGEDATAAAET